MGGGLEREGSGQLKESNRSEVLETFSSTSPISYRRLKETSRTQVASRI